MGEGVSPDPGGALICRVACVAEAQGTVIAIGLAYRGDEQLRFPPFPGDS
jgi:hypothetical protein